MSKPVPSYRKKLSSLSKTASKEIVQGKQAVHESSEPTPSKSTATGKEGPEDSSIPETKKTKKERFVITYS